MRTNVLFCICLIFCAFLSTTTAAEELNLNQRALDAQDSIFAEKYEEAEVVIRECLQVVPKDLNFLSNYKIIVLLKEKGDKPRVFKLEMSNLDRVYYALRELYLDRGGGAQIIS